MKNKVSFLFGAGAELSFDLINGKDFAFELFKYLITNPNMKEYKYKRKGASPKEKNTSSDERIHDVYLDKIFSIIFDKEKHCYNNDLLKRWFLEKDPFYGTSYKISPEYCLELLKNSLEENRNNIINEYTKNNSDGSSHLDKKIKEIFKRCINIKASDEGVSGQNCDNFKNEQPVNSNSKIEKIIINHYLNKVIKNFPIISNNDKNRVEELKGLQPLSNFYNYDYHQYDTNDKKDNTFNKVINSFLESEYFSFLVYSVLVLNTAKKDNDSKDDDVQKAIKYLSSFIQFVIGANIYEFMDGFNQSLNLSSKTDTHQIEGFKQIWNFEDIISLDYTKLSFEGIKSLFKENCNPVDIDETISTDKIEQVESKIISCACYNLFKDVVVSYLDYKQVIDSNWMYLYSPRRNWNKFVKMSVFLLGVRNFVISFINHCENISKEKIKSSYYYDVFTKFNVAALGTTNYTSLLQQVFRYYKKKDLFSSKLNPCFFNGSLYHWYSPCTNEVITSFSDKDHIFNKKSQNLSDYELSTWSPYDDNSKPKDELNFYIPLIFTQSGTRPMTDITMAKDFVRFYDQTVNKKN